MLKIKDNVDLKELEKYGFIILGKKHALYLTETKYKDMIGIYVYEPERIIGIESVGDVENLDILYDLIKDDMVEKVEEK